MPVPRFGPLWPQGGDQVGLAEIRGVLLREHRVERGRGNTRIPRCCGVMAITDPRYGLAYEVMVRRGALWAGPCLAGPAISASYFPSPERCGRCAGPAAFNFRSSSLAPVPPRFARSAGRGSSVVPGGRDHPSAISSSKFVRCPIRPSAANAHESMLLLFRWTGAAGALQRRSENLLVSEERRVRRRRGTPDAAAREAIRATRPAEQIGSESC